MLTVELFAGIGGFRIAADELGFETVWANEIDEKAATVYRNRFGGDVLQQGDIWQYKNAVPQHDLLTGGFPCQPFSSAGKKRGIEDPRGTLFEAICAILTARRPRFFLLENVKRLLSMDSGRHFATILDALSKVGYSIEWRLLNTKNFGLPQNRQRIVIAGRLDEVVPGTARFVEKSDLRSIRSKDLEKVCNESLWEKLASCGRPFPTWGLCKNGRWAGIALEGVQTGIPLPTFGSLLETDVPESFFMTESTLERIAKSDRVEKFYDGVEILYNQGGAHEWVTRFTECQESRQLSPVRPAGTTRDIRSGVNIEGLLPMSMLDCKAFPIITAEDLVATVNMRSTAMLHPRLF